MTPEFGEVVENWQAPRRPMAEALQGARIVLEPLNAKRHAAGLHAGYSGHDQVWDFLPYGPFPTVAELRSWAEDVVTLPDHQFYAIRCTETGDYRGVASYLRISPQAGSIEVGHINFSPALQGTTAATETMFVMMRWAFEAGYRRYEWKCDALNLPSRRAAQRLGLSFEGVFRQAAVIKGRNRDTAWFAAIDREWPHLRRAFEAWLAPENFVSGRQVRSLKDLTAPIRVASDPAL